MERGHRGGWSSQYLEDWGAALPGIFIRTATTIEHSIRVLRIVPDFLVSPHFRRVSFLVLIHFNSG